MRGSYEGRIANQILGVKAVQSLSFKSKFKETVNIVTGILLWLSVQY